MANAPHTVLVRLMGLIALLGIALVLLRMTNRTDMEPQSLETEWNYPRIITTIARDIEALTNEFPQLAEFTAAQHADIENLTIGYQYRTGEPRGGAGWAGGVPWPDGDGIWFHIDLHDPDSDAQIHTQPVTPNVCIGEKRVSFLVIEGTNAPPVESRLWSILEHQGMKPCGG